jgi:hypothetical protein
MKDADKIHEPVYMATEEEMAVFQAMATLNEYFGKRFCADDSVEEE